MNSFFLLLFVSMVFIITGHWMYRKPPKEPNLWKGYRTKRSKSSQEAWDFAQKFSSEWMVKVGYFLGIFSTIFLLLPDTTTMIVFATFCISLGCVVPLIKTEQALKKKFE